MFGRTLWRRLRMLLMENILATAIGFIIGIAGNWLFWRYLLFIRPKVVLRPKIAAVIDE